jgi:ADP-ribosylglycohydrolase
MGPSQITDDSEMAMCIMHGLTDEETFVQESKKDVGKILNLDGIAYYFGIWQ